MTVTQELIARLRTHAQTLGHNPTNYAAANLLGVSHSRMGNWSVGRSGMSDEAVTDACELLWPGDQVMLSYWLTRRHAEQAPAERRKAWKFVVDQLSQNATVREGLKKSAAAVILAAGVGFGGVAAPAPAQANADSLNIMLNRRRRRLQSGTGPLPVCVNCTAFAAAA